MDWPHLRYDLSMVEPRRSTIIATHVYRYLQCEHAVFRAFFENPDRKVEPHRGLQLIFDQGNRHEDRIVAALGWPEPEYPPGDWEAGLAATRALMAEGVPGISQGVLVHGDRVGRPDLLRRIEEPSSLGPWRYEAGDVKSSATPHSEQVLQVAFYADLLQTVQGVIPDSGYLVLGDGREERFELGPFLLTLEEVLTEIREIRDGTRHPELHLDEDCGACEWRQACRGDAETADHLSRVAGLGRGLTELLRQAGVNSTRELAAADVHELAEAGVAAAPVLQRYVRRAQAITEGTPLLLGPPHLPPPPGATYLVVAEDPHRPGGAFVWGILQITPQGREFRRAVILARSPADERKAWPWILAQVGRGGPTHRLPVFHSGGLTAARAETLQSVHGGDEKVFKYVHDHAIDLRRMLQRSLALPAPSSTLRAFDGLRRKGDDPFEDGPGREAHYGGGFGPYPAWYAEWLASEDDSWLERLRAAVHRELDALRALHLQLSAPASKAAPTRPHKSPAPPRRRPAGAGASGGSRT